MSALPRGEALAPRRIEVTLLIATLEQSGAEKQLALLAEHLPRKDFALNVIALTRGGYFAETLRRAQVPVHVLGKRWKFDPASLIQLRRLVRGLAPDVLHAWMFTANAYARLACSGREGPPILISERGADGWKAGWQHWLDRRLAPRATRLVVNSVSVAEQAAQRGFPTAQIVVVPNAIDVTPGDPPMAPRPSGVPPGGHLVGYVGRLAAGKRVEDLIQAALRLRASFADLHLLLVGDGPRRNALERFTQEVGATDCVAFLGHRHDAGEILRQCDAFWLASESEGMSNSLMEAMAAGVPVVVTDIPTNRELVADGVTGSVVPLGDPIALADATARLWRDPTRTAALVTAARAHVERSFGVPSMVEAYARLYREVAGVGRGVSATE